MLNYVFIRVFESISQEGFNTNLRTFEGKGAPQLDDNQKDESNLLQDLSKYKGQGFKHNFISEF